MGQKAITLTLRKHNERLDSRSLSPKEFTNSLTFMNTLKRSFEKKGVFVTYTNFNIIGKTSYLTMHLFYRTKILTKFRKKRARYLKIKILKFKRLKAKKNNAIANLIKKTFNTNAVVVKTSLINLYLKKKPLLYIYHKAKKYNKKLFSRRYTLYMDFMKLTRLFTIKKINVKAYLITLASVFKALHKKSHGLFFIFLKMIIYRLIRDEKSRILGVKVIVNGKLKGKQRSSSKTISVGKLGTQTISADMHFSRIHLFTLYGAYGIKFWVNYKLPEKKKTIKIKK